MQHCYSDVMLAHSNEVPDTRYCYSMKGVLHISTFDMICVYDEM